MFLNKIGFLLIALFGLTGCATTVTKIDPTDTFPGYEMRTYVFGNAELAESAQSFQGTLIILTPDGKSFSIELANGQEAEGLSTTSLEAIGQTVAETIRRIFIPVPPLEPLLP